MITVITATGSVIQVAKAEITRLQDGCLICEDDAGKRIVGFAVQDVKAYAVETPRFGTPWLWPSVPA